PTPHCLAEMEERGMKLSRALSSTACLLVLGALSLSSASESAAKKAKSSEQKHWAFRPVRQHTVPVVRAASWVRNPIDAFVLARLEKNKLKPAPVAGQRTLLRRVYLDLIGLPPTPREMRAFLEDPSPDPYARVVEDLLARPQYGERWA